MDLQSLNERSEASVLDEYAFNGGREISQIFVKTNESTIERHEGEKLNFFRKVKLVSFNFMLTLKGYSTFFGNRLILQLPQS